MASVAQVATLDDLDLVGGKAEVIAGRIVHFMPTGRKPNRVASRIFRSLDDYATTTGKGETYTGTIGFTVPMLTSGRESFSPDASYFLGPFPDDDMRFLEGPPTFAVEVRGENDYTAAARSRMHARCADYFEAGTVVVWDVDPIAGLVHSYHAEFPDEPICFECGDEAHAEPAVPGWRIAVDRLFE